MIFKLREINWVHNSSSKWHHASSHITNLCDSPFPEQKRQKQRIVISSYFYDFCLLQNIPAMNHRNEIDSNERAMKLLLRKYTFSRLYHFIANQNMEYFLLYLCCWINDSFCSNKKITRECGVGLSSIVLIHFDVFASPFLCFHKKRENWILHREVLSLNLRLLAGMSDALKLSKNTVNDNSKTNIIEKTDIACIIELNCHGPNCIFESQAMPFRLGWAA